MKEEICYEENHIISIDQDIVYTRYAGTNDQTLAHKRWQELNAITIQYNIARELGGAYANSNANIYYLKNGGYYYKGNIDGKQIEIPYGTSPIRVKNEEYGYGFASYYGIPAIVRMCN